MTKIPVSHSLIFANPLCKQTTGITRTLTCVQKKGSVYEYVMMFHEASATSLLDEYVYLFFFFLNFLGVWEFSKKTGGMDHTVAAPG